MRCAAIASLLLLACAPAQVTVVMNAQNNSGQSGLATITDLGSTTRVEVRIRRSEFDETQPVHLHTGRCGEIGPRADIGARAMTVGLPEMAAQGDGGFATSEATVDFTFRELTNGDWVINVHDKLDFALYVACGNIN